MVAQIHRVELSPHYEVKCSLISIIDMSEEHPNLQTDRLNKRWHINKDWRNFP